MICFITLILCFNTLIHLNEGLNDFGITPNDAQDSFEDYETEFYGNDEILSEELGKSTCFNQFEAQSYT